MLIEKNDVFTARAAAGIRTRARTLGHVALIIKKAPIPGRQAAITAAEETLDTFLAGLGLPTSDHLAHTKLRPFRDFPDPADSLRYRVLLAAVNRAKRRLYRRLPTPMWHLELATGEVLQGTAGTAGFSTRALYCRLADEAYEQWEANWDEIGDEQRVRRGVECAKMYECRLQRRMPGRGPHAALDGHLVRFVRDDRGVRRRGRWPVSRSEAVPERGEQPGVTIEARHLAVDLLRASPKYNGGWLTLDELRVVMRRVGYRGKYAELPAHILFGALYDCVPLTRWADGVTSEVAARAAEGVDLLARPQAATLAP